MFWNIFPPPPSSFLLIVCGLVIYWIIGWSILLQISFLSHSLILYRVYYLFLLLSLIFSSSVFIELVITFHLDSTQNWIYVSISVMLFVLAFNANKLASYSRIVSHWCLIQYGKFPTPLWPGFFFSLNPLVLSANLGFPYINAVCSVVHFADFATSVPFCWMGMKLLIIYLGNKYVPHHIIWQRTLNLPSFYRILILVNRSRWSFYL